MENFGRSIFVESDWVSWEKPDDTTQNKVKMKKNEKAFLIFIPFRFNKTFLNENISLLNYRLL